MRQPEVSASLKTQCSDPRQTKPVRTQLSKVYENRASTFLYKNAHAAREVLGFAWQKYYIIYVDSFQQNITK